MKYGASPFDLLEDVAGFGGPDEGLGMFIMTVDVLVDSCDKFLNAAESSAAQPIFRQVTEEAFHHVQPGAAFICANKDMNDLWVQVDHVRLKTRQHLTAGLAANPFVYPVRMFRKPRSADWLLTQ